jgi:glycine dehydrogenase subunit 1
LSRLPGYALLNDRPFFKEFPLRCPGPIDEINEYLLDEWGVVGGYNLGKDYPGLDSTMLVCCTEMNSKEEIDLLVEALGSMEGQP